MNAPNERDISAPIGSWFDVSGLGTDCLNPIANLLSNKFETIAGSYVFRCSAKAEQVDLRMQHVLGVGFPP